MAEQINIRKAKLTQRLLARKTEEEDLDNVLAAYQQELDDVNETIRELRNLQPQWKKRTVSGVENIRRRASS